MPPPPPQWMPRPEPAELPALAMLRAVPRSSGAPRGRRRPLAGDRRWKDQAASCWASLRETFAAAWFWDRTEPTVPDSISPASWPPSSITTLP